jgi:hypothetical protein
VLLVVEATLPIYSFGDFEIVAPTTDVGQEYDAVVLQSVYDIVCQWVLVRQDGVQRIEDFDFSWSVTKVELRRSSKVSRILLLTLIRPLKAPDL